VICMVGCSVASLSCCLTTASDVGDKAPLAILTMAAAMILRELPNEWDGLPTACSSWWPCLMAHRGVTLI
jgi:hypothetical protein